MLAIASYALLQTSVPLIYFPQLLASQSRNCGTGGPPVIWSEAIFSGTGGSPVFWSEAIFNSYHGHLARA